MPTTSPTDELATELEQLATANRARLKGTKRNDPHEGYLMPAGATDLPKPIREANQLALERLLESREATAEAMATQRALRDAAVIDRRAIDTALAAGDEPPESTEPAKRHAAEIAERRRLLTRERAWAAVFALHDAIAEARASAWPAKQRDRLRSRAARIAEQHQEIDRLRAALAAEETQLGVEYSALAKIEDDSDLLIDPPPRASRR